MIDINDLEIFGLNRNLALIYVAILQSKGMSPPELEKATGINRTNIYPLAQHLVDNKLVSLDFVGGKRRYTARDPAALKELTTKRLEAIEKYMPELKALYGSANGKPKISYYEGTTAARTIYEELNNIVGDCYCYFGTLAAQLALESRDATGKYLKKRLRRGIGSRTILTKPGPGAPRFKDDKKNLKQVRYFPGQMPDDMPNIYIYDNSMAVLATAPENYAVVIDSPELSRTIKALFEFVWNISLRSDESAPG
ncbi:MAG: hypothetical protein LBF58_00720 [Deltaproteobacteria bacterium]|jgi:sugar-specific transcriptional regulator TrmB|nr:hypothetical protein [Deltaproteobacteria bacterium]